MPVPAPLQLTDGASHTISSGSQDGIIVSAATTLIMTGGASTGIATHTSGSDQVPAIQGIYGDLGSTITQSGGTVTGGAGSSGFGCPTAAHESNGCYVAISGGTNTGGADPDKGAPAIQVTSPLSFAISGGTHTGGATTTGPGGSAVDVGLDGSVAGTISGGTFTAGAGTTSAPLVQYAVEDTASLTVSGGGYTGIAWLALADSGSVVFTGSGLAYSGGVLTGTLTDSSAIAATIVNAGASLSASGSGASVTFTA